MKAEEEDLMEPTAKRVKFDSQNGNDGGNADLEEEKNNNLPKSVDVDCEEEDEEADGDYVGQTEEETDNYETDYEDYGVDEDENGKAEMLLVNPFTYEEAQQLKSEARSIGFAEFTRKHMEMETPIIKLMHAFGFPLPVGFLDLPADQQERKWMIFAGMLKRFCQIRFKLPIYNTIEDAVELLKKSRRVLVLTGAGISVSCGIPDFRSENGLYNIISEKYPDLDDPQLMFDIHYFRHNHLPFFELAKEIFPSNFKPSPTHMFIKMLEDQGKLLRNYTQNIDTLEKLAGITRVIHCHGSFDTATCQKCKLTVDGNMIKEDILKQQTPFCSQCSQLAEQRQSKSGGDDEEDDDDEKESILPIMKPDIVFFGENLPAEFDRMIEIDRMEADLMIVIGSSLKVAPVSDLVGLVPHHIPLILINREPVYHMHRSFDIQLLGFCDEVVKDLCRRLVWNLPVVETNSSDREDEEDVVHVPPHVYLFKGNKFNHEKHSRIYHGDESDDYETESDTDTEEEMPTPHQNNNQNDNITDNTVKDVVVTNNSNIIEE